MPTHETHCLLCDVLPMSAAPRAGIMDAVVFSEEQREELHKVEAQIRRRVAIGAHVSERKVHLP